MAYVKYWKTLQNTAVAANKSHTLESVINGAAPKGSGEMIWVDGVPPPTNIFGYRTSRTDNTTGYWQRSSDIDANIRWFGATGKDATMLAQGVTQIDADLWYGLGFCDVTKDTCDTTAFRYAMKLMEGNIFRNILINTGNYYINRTMELPERLNNGEKNLHYMLSGYGALLLVASNAKTTNFTFFDNQVVDMSEASTEVERRLFIQGLQIIGSNRTQKAINVECGYGCAIKDLYVKDCSYGIHVKFALKTEIVNCMFGSCDRAISVDRGDWVGVGLSNAQSNSTTVTSCRTFACRIAYEILDASGCTFRDVIAEGPPNSCEYAFYIDAMGATVVKDIEIYDPHLETAFTKAGFYINSAPDMVSIVEGLFSQYDCLMFDVVGAAYSTIEVRRTVYVTGGSKLKSTGVVQWLDDNNRKIDFTDTNRWIAGTMPPTSRIVRYFPSGFAK